MKQTLILFIMIVGWSIGLAQDNILNFDGGNDYMHVDDGPLLDFGTNDFTVECWVRKLGGSNNWSNTYVVSKWNSGGVPGSNEWVITMTQGGSNNLPRFVIESGNTIHFADGTTSMVIGTWYHLAGARQGSLMSFYVNGVLEGTSTTLGTAAVNNVGRDLRMATNNNCCGNSLSPNSKMEMEELRIWNIARPAAEIQANMNTTISPSSLGLVAYYQFDQGTACGNNTTMTTITDATNGLDGSLVNFTMSGGCVSNMASESALPVELLGFSASLQDGHVELTWATATELGNKGFEVLRTTDFKKWTTLDFVPGNGRTDRFSEYSFEDQPNRPGTYYYRLKQLDFDENFEYSPVASILWKGDERAVAISPNPVTYSLFVKLNNSPESPQSMVIFSATGQQVYQAVLENEQTEIGLGHLPGGLYFLQIEGRAELLKLIKK